MMGKILNYVTKFTLTLQFILERLVRVFLVGCLKFMTSFLVSSADEQDNLSQHFLSTRMHFTIILHKIAYRRLLMY